MSPTKNILPLLLLCLCWTTSAIAGIGPENVVLVVNGDSSASRQVANFYAERRNIPSSNVIVLDDVPADERIDVAKFRELILRPVIQECVKRRIDDHLQMIVYSSDFPTAINIEADLRNFDGEIPRVYTKVASINSLTYLYQAVLAENPAYISLDVNRYFQQSAEDVLRLGLRGPDKARTDRAVELYDERDYEASAEIWNELAEQNPDNAILHYWRARCAAWQQKEATSREALQAAVNCGWHYAADTLVDAAFSAVRDESWFNDLLDPFPRFAPGSISTQPFDARRTWYHPSIAHPTATSGHRMVLSVVLGITRNDFMTVEEVLANLDRSIAADDSQPRGTFYFSQTSNVRSTTRQPGFAAAMRELTRLGMRAETVTDKYPVNRDDVLGAMVGVGRLQLEKSHSTILPGAICENLTSYGGIFYRQTPQIPLTEFLKMGAAGSSGTVTEPYAIQQKFPIPFLHVHYARGSTLAEAFYQSVQGPYQLLIVGDPLCRPFAKPPVFETIGLEQDESVGDRIEVAVLPDDDTPTQIESVDYYLDDRRIKSLGPDETLTLETTGLPAGYHEVRVVAIGCDLMKTPATQLIPFQISRNDWQIDVSIESGSSAALSDQVQGTVSAPGADEVVLVHRQELVGRIRGAEGDFAIDASKLGAGRVALQAVASFDGKPMMSKPVWVEITQ